MPYANPEDRRAWKRRYAARNPEQIKESAKRWYEKSGAEWRDKNKDRLAAWREANRDRIKGYRAKYREEDRLTGYRRFQKMGLSKGEAAVLVAQKTSCAFCGEVSGLQLDHVTPRSRGGSNRPENLQWLCATCNVAKGALTPGEFLAHIRKILSRAGG